MRVGLNLNYNTHKINSNKNTSISMAQQISFKANEEVSFIDSLIEKARSWFVKRETVRMQSRIVEQALIGDKLIKAALVEVKKEIPPISELVEPIYEVKTKEEDGVKRRTEKTISFLPYEEMIDYKIFIFETKNNSKETHQKEIHYILDKDCKLMKVTISDKDMLDGVCFQEIYEESTYRSDGILATYHGNLKSTKLEIKEAIDDIQFGEDLRPTRMRTVKKDAKDPQKDTDCTAYYKDGELVDCILKYYRGVERYKFN